MIAALLRFSLIQRLMILLVTFGIAAAGFWSFKTWAIFYVVSSIMMGHV